MTPLVFLDTETTSLERPSSRTPGEVWEVALIVRRPDSTADEAWHWFLPVTLEHADPVSLGIGRFHERHPQGALHQTSDYVPPLTPVAEFIADLVAAIPEGAHLVGNVVSFDEERLAAILHAHGVTTMPWHYHLVDVEALAAGWVHGAASLITSSGIVDNDRHTAAMVAALRRQGTPPWDSEDLCEAIGVDPNAYDRHTALSDAYWARDIYDAVTATSEVTA